MTSIDALPEAWPVVNIYSVQDEFKFYDCCTGWCFAQCAGLQLAAPLQVQPTISSIDLPVPILIAPRKGLSPKKKTS